MDLRKAALEAVRAERAKGPEAGNETEQASGKLAELVLKRLIPDVQPPSDLGHDFVLASGVRIDSKCRGGTMPFQIAYRSEGQRRPREAKHNFFARQLLAADPRYTADAYVLSHLRLPSSRQFPGTTRQRNWELHVCGWVFAKRAARGMFLPRGALTEQGRTWFVYRGMQVEFYHRCLRPVWLEGNVLRPFADLSLPDVHEDEARSGDIHLTSVDLDRIAADLRGLGILDGPGPAIESSEPILDPNQYWHAASLLGARPGVRIDEDALRRYVGGPRRFEGLAGRAKARGEGERGPP